MKVKEREVIFLFREHQQDEAREAKSKTNAIVLMIQEEKEIHAFP